MEHVSRSAPEQQPQTGPPPRRYGGVSGEQRRAARRARLLEAGLELIGTLGWEQTTMTAVCGKARLTERYFYESFRNREDLLLAVLDAVAEQIRLAIVDALRAQRADPEAAVRAAVEAFVDALTEDPRRARLTMVEAVAAPPLRRRRSELMREFATLIVAQNQRLYGASALEGPQAEISAILYVGGVAELFTAWLSGDLAASRAQVVDAAVGLFAAAAHS
jgi:AcrR family transcriptional regulator